ncbi:hypothetical protein PVK06_007548 [Gossypium arboreum]|uniref:Uncharacterized protein n=1 Tax=Gossypium arboreum TaxID=29729 RepID=A0ABR0QHL7_GOSAR|nr:hypothetical protein PVK06_007548 [Gossypium arboreum]
MSPPEAQPKARNRWRDFDSIARCYMLASMSSVLQKQHENFCTVKEIMTNLEDLLRGHAALARQSAITNLMNSHKKPGTLVKEHMIKLMGIFVEVEDNRVELDGCLQLREKGTYLDSTHEGITIP